MIQVYSMCVLKKKPKSGRGDYGYQEYNSHLGVPKEAYRNTLYMYLNVSASSFLILLTIGGPSYESDV